MDNTELEKIASLITNIRDNELEEMEYIRKQSRRMNIISIISLSIVTILTLIIITIIPKLMSFVNSTNEIVKEANIVLDDAKEAVANLNKVSEELATVEFDDLFEEVDNLVENSQKSIDETMKEIKKIDFDGLNNAIKSLEAIVAPLSKLSLFGR